MDKTNSNTQNNVKNTEEVVTDTSEGFPPTDKASNNSVYCNAPIFPQTHKDHNLYGNTYNRNTNTITNANMYSYLDAADILAIERRAKENFVEKNHHRKISHVKNRNLWRTNIGNPRKQVTYKERDDLIDFLWRYYSSKNQLTTTVIDVFERYQLYHKEIDNVSENTIVRNRQAFTRFFDNSFLATDIQVFTDSDLAAYINKRTKELQIKDRALEDAFRLLNRTFLYAINSERILESNPVSRINIHHYYKNCICTRKTANEKIFTPNEIEAIRNRILEEMANKDYDIIGYAVLFSIETGVRVAEIPPLRWRDIEENLIHIHRQQRITRIKGQPRVLEELPYTKEERQHPNGGRYFPLTNRIKKILREIQTKQARIGISSEFIFCDRRGDWINKETYSQRLRRLCRRIGLNITNNHAFRMSLNSNVFIPMGIPVTQRAYLLGHTVEVNERFYSHMRTDSLSDLKNILNQAGHTRSHTFLA